MDYLDLVKSRYAVKKFNGEIVSDDTIEKLKELIRYSPSSFGLQPWKIYVVQNKKTKELLLEHSFNQPQITTCSHLFVFCTDIDVFALIEEYEKVMKKENVPAKNIANFSKMIRAWASSKNKNFFMEWGKNQVFIALSNALNAAKYLGIDSCPMGGFILDKYAKTLHLPENIIPTVLLPVGYPADNPKQKIRFSKDYIFVNDSTN